MTGYEALRTGAAWIDLSNRGKIRVNGEDRARLLHAMSTNHIAGLQPNEGVYTFFLTAQGRIVADAYIYNLGDSLLVDTEPETGEKLREHLDKYIIADDATLEDESARWAVIALEGPGSIEAAQSLGIPVPEKQCSVAAWKDGFVARLATTGSTGLRVFMPTGQKEGFTAVVDAPEATSAEARTVRLENGRPRFGEDISERYLVQETQQFHAVHSNKGCYLGQEIVERVRSRGQVHRLLSPLRIRSATAPPPGTKLSADGKDLAEITSAAYSPAFGEVVALGYVRAEALQTKPELTLPGSEAPITAYLP
jgi:folate-binding protein YgfZ